MQYILTNNIQFGTDLAESKEVLKDIIKKLNAVAEKPTVNVRIQQTNDLIEAYVEATGQRPDPYELYAMGSYIMDDYLTDQYKHAKSKGHEYPFQTDKRVQKNHARHRTAFIGDRTDV